MLKTKNLSSKNQVSDKSKCASAAQRNDWFWIKWQLINTCKLHAHALETTAYSIVYIYIFTSTGCIQGLVGYLKHEDDAIVAMAAQAIQFLSVDVDNRIELLKAKDLIPNLVGFLYSLDCKAYVVFTFCCLLCVHDLGLMPHADVNAKHLLLLNFAILNLFIASTSWCFLYVHGLGWMSRADVGSAYQQ